MNTEAKINKAVVWKKRNKKYDGALHLEKINPKSDDGMTWRCACKLHNDIFAVPSRQICEPVTVENITEGEAITPDSF